MKVSKRVSIGAVMAIVALFGATMFGGVADAQKKKGKKTKKAKPATATGTAGAVPNGPASTLVNPVPFKGTANLSSKKLKRKVIGDVDVTLSTSGVSGSASAVQGNPVADLRVRITAPNGTTTEILNGGSGTDNVAGLGVTALTLSDDTPTKLCGTPPPNPTPPPTIPPPPPCGDPDATLVGPSYSGTAQPIGGLDLLDLGPARGTYTLTAWDTDGLPVVPPATTTSDNGTNTIVSWSITVTPLAPIT